MQQQTARDIEALTLAICAMQPTDLDRINELSQLRMCSDEAVQVLIEIRERMRTREHRMARALSLFRGDGPVRCICGECSGEAL